MEHNDEALLADVRALVKAAQEFAHWSGVFRSTGSCQHNADMWEARLQKAVRALPVDVFDRLRLVEREPSILQPHTPDDCKGWTYTGAAPRATFDTKELAEAVTPQPAPLGEECELSDEQRIRQVSALNRELLARNAALVAELAERREIVSDWVADISQRDDGAVFWDSTKDHERAWVNYGDLRKLMERDSAVSAGKEAQDAQ